MNTQTNEQLPALADVGAIELTANGVKMSTVAQVAGFCGLCQRAGMLPKGTSLEGAVVAVLAGARLGLDAFQAIQGISVINGRPALWGDALVAIVKGSGLLEDEKVEYLPTRKDCLGVRYTCKRKGIHTPYEGTFTKADAEKAGLWGKNVWGAYPARMMLSRARAYALRDAFADVLKGFRVAEEEQDVVDASPTAPAPEKPRKKRAAASEILEIPAELAPAPTVVQPPDAFAQNSATSTMHPGITTARNVDAMENDENPVAIPEFLA